MPRAQTTTPEASAARSARRLWLASSSPRRRLLLEEAGFRFEILPARVDDAQLRIPKGVTPEQWTASLAVLKARAAAERLPQPARDGVVLAADTTVVKNDAVIGQPADEADARRILALLSDGSHDVVTGVAILCGDRRRAFADTARVTVGPLEQGVVERYVKSGLWRGKAGAYNLAERLDDGWPISYEGDPGTIMGLPMRRLAPMLREMLDRAE